MELSSNESAVWSPTIHHTYSDSGSINDDKVSVQPDSSTAVADQGSTGQPAQAGDRRITQHADEPKHVGGTFYRAAFFDLFKESVLLVYDVIKYIVYLVY